MKKVSMVKVVVAKCNAALSVNKSIMMAAVYDADTSSEEMRQDMFAQERKTGVYIQHFIEFDPMPEWMVDEVLMSVGVTSDSRVLV